MTAKHTNRRVVCYAVARILPPHYLASAFIEVTSELHGSRRPLHTPYTKPHDLSRFGVIGESLCSDPIGHTDSNLSLPKFISGQNATPSYPSLTATYDSPNQIATSIWYRHDAQPLVSATKFDCEQNSSHETSFQLQETYFLQPIDAPCLLLDIGPDVVVCI